MACIAAASLLASGASAQSQWMYSLVAPVEVEHDSNPKMRPGAAEAVTRLRVSPQLRALHRSGADEIHIDAVTVVERSSKEGLSGDRVDPRVRADWRRASARTDYSVFGIFEQRSYRTLEAEEEVPLGVDGTRSLWALGAVATHSLNERDTLAAEVRHDRVDFDAGAVSDYELTAANLQFSHLVSERSSAYATGTRQVYRPTGGTGPHTEDSVSSGLVLGWRQSVSQALDWDASLGVANISGLRDSSSLQGALRVTWNMERLQASLDVSRRPSPIAESAALGLSDFVRLQLRRLVDARSSLLVEANATRFATGARGATYAIAFTHELAQAWSLTARVLHRQREDAGGRASANVIGLLLTYNDPDL